MLSCPLWIACITSFTLYFGFFACAIARGANANAPSNARHLYMTIDGTDYNSVSRRHDGCTGCCQGFAGHCTQATTTTGDKRHHAVEYAGRAALLNLCLVHCRPFQLLYGGSPPTSGYA